MAFQMYFIAFHGEFNPETSRAVQQLVHERTMYAHIWQLAGLWAVGPRVGESGLGLIPGHGFSAPYEDVTLVAK